MSEQGSTGPDAPEQAKDDAPEQAKDDAPEQAKDDAPEQAKDETTRRVFMAGGAAAALGAAAARAAARAGGPSTVTSAQARLRDKVTAAAGSASLSDVRHIVILMQENRSC